MYRQEENTIMGGRFIATMKTLSEGAVTRRGAVRNKKKEDKERRGLQIMQARGEKGK